MYFIIWTGNKYAHIEIHPIQPYYACTYIVNQYCYVQWFFTTKMLSLFTSLQGIVIFHDFLSLSLINISQNCEKGLGITCVLETCNFIKMYMCHCLRTHRRQNRTPKWCKWLQELCWSLQRTTTHHYRYIFWYTMHTLYCI